MLTQSISTNNTQCVVRAPAVELLLTPYSAMQERQVDWLWYPYIPLGALTTVEGNMGEGKSWFTLALAAAVSTGRFPLTHERRKPALTLHLDVEDDPEATILPRLRLLGADCRFILNIGDTRRQTAEGAQFLDFTLEDLPALYDAVTEMGVKLVILDPMQAYLPRGADMNKAESMRPLMTAPSHLARDTQSAVMIVRHFGKRVS